MAEATLIPLSALRAGQVPSNWSMAGPNPWFDVTHPSFAGGAKGAGDTDDTAAITAAITAAAAAGGIVYFPRGIYLVSASLPIKSNVVYLGAGPSVTASSPAPPSQLKASSTMATPIFDVTAAGTIDSPTWRWLGLSGSNLSGNKGIHSGSAVTMNQPNIEDCFFDSFGDQGVHFQAGVGGYFNNLFLQNCLTIRTGRTDFVGAFECALTDCYYENVFATASSLQTDAVGSGYLCGIVVRGANAFLVNCAGDISLTGIYVASTATWCRFTSCRAQLNNGNGFRVDGAQNSFVNCYAERNSNAADNTYDGFLTTGNGNQYVGCYAEGLAADTRQMRYAFTDTVANGPPTYYVFCRVGANLRNTVLVNPTSGSIKPQSARLTSSGVLIEGNNGQTDLTISDTGSIAGFELSGSGGNKFLRVSGLDLQVVNSGNTAIILSIQDTGTIVPAAQVYPGAEATGQQTTGGLLHSTGVPANGNGNNNDFAISDNNNFYVRAGGVWSPVAWPSNTQQSQPANPTGTTSTTGVMMGLAVAFTPKATGKVKIVISGDIFNATAIADGGSVQIRHGTGTAPANAAALAGTADGGQPSYIAATTAEKAPFSLNAIISGLSVGVAIWVDLALAAITGGTATVENLSVSIEEV